MTEETDLGGIKVPLTDLETTPESIKQVLKILLQRIEELEERLNKNSKNSSIPPSKNGFGVSADKQVKAKKKPLKRVHLKFAMSINTQSNYENKNG
jgi:hypothetical protein